MLETSRAGVNTRKKEMMYNMLNSLRIILRTSVPSYRTKQTRPLAKEVFKEGGGVGSIEDWRPIRPVSRHSSNNNEFKIQVQCCLSHKMAEIYIARDRCSF